MHERFRLLAGLAFLMFLPTYGCATFRPSPAEPPDFLARAQSREERGVQVTVAVPSAAETRRHFGRNLYSGGIQPVFVRIENGTQEGLALFPLTMDPDYFSPGEAVWSSRFFLGGSANDSMSDYFHQAQVPVIVGPGVSLQGFVFTNRDDGLKYVEVDLRGDEEPRHFDFVFEVPGIELDYHRVDWDALYSEEEIVELDDTELREMLEGLPCCALGGDRKSPGDPLNIVVIAGEGFIAHPFLKQGWDPTETIRTSTVIGTALSSVLGRTYRTSPMSALYFDDRPQEMGLQKARRTVDERNHLRLWVTPYLYEGKHVWIGQISRDIGVRLSRRTLITHQIDGDVDEARYYLMQDMLLSGRVSKMMIVEGVGAAPKEAPRYNYTLDPYFTDGARFVFVVSDEFVAPEDVEIVDWTAGRLSQ
jgi:hypothetical protein